MTKKHFFRSGPLLGIIALALIWVASAATPADALVAAGTSIDNQATVSYNEGADVPSNTVSTTVNLVSGLAWDDITLNPVSQSTGSASLLPLVYTADLINLGNGATTATITDGTTQAVPANLTAGTWTINGVASPAIPLGGTVSTGPGVVNGANTDIPISNALASGIVATDIVRIGSTNYNVVSVVAGTLTIDSNAGGIVGTAGIQIGEVVEVTFNGTTGTLQNSSLSELHLHAMLATDELGGAGGNGGNNADGNPAATDTINSDGTNAWQTSVVAGALSITKYVRNATTDNAGTAPAFPYDGNNYYLAGVTGNSDPDGAGALVGDTLEYLIVITNAGPGSATDVTVTDDISAFLGLTTTSVDIDADGDGTFIGASDVTDALNNDGAAVTGTVLTVYAGVGGSAAGPNGGTIDFDGTPTSAVRFQAAIQ